MDLGKVSSFFGFIVDKDPHCGAIHVLELAVTHGPKKSSEPAKAEEQGNRNENGNSAHCAAFRRRKALATTMIEEPDMANAAISGVTLPMNASGTATTL